MIRYSYVNQSEQSIKSKMRRDTIKFKSSSLFDGCCVPPSSLLWMIIALFVFFIVVSLSGCTAIWSVCSYYRRRTRRQVEKEQQQRREDEDRLKLELYRQKQLDLQMIMTTRDNRLGSKEPYSRYSRECVDPRVQYMPCVPPPLPGQYPGGVCNINTYGRQMTCQSAVSSKQLKELELLDTTTARTPSEERQVKNSRKKLESHLQKDRQTVDNIKDLKTGKRDDKGSKIQPGEKIDKKVVLEGSKKDTGVIENVEEHIPQNVIPEPCKEFPTTRKQEKHEDMKRPGMKVEKETPKYVKEKSRLQTLTPMTQPERYRHQIDPHHVHEWISRIGHVSSPIPYVSPNKRILLVAQPSTENDPDKIGSKVCDDTREMDNYDKSERFNSLEILQNTQNKIFDGTTDVELSPEIVQKSTPAISSVVSPISAVLNTPPKSAFSDDQPYWMNRNNRENGIKMREDSNTDKLKEKLWKPPDKRAEARLNRFLECPWLSKTPSGPNRSLISPMPQSVPLPPIVPVLKKHNRSPICDFLRDNAKKSVNYWTTLLDKPPSLRRHVAQRICLKHNSFSSFL